MWPPLGICTIIIFNLFPFHTLAWKLLDNTLQLVTRHKSVISQKVMSLKINVLCWKQIPLSSYNGRATTTTRLYKGKVLVLIPHCSRSFAKCWHFPPWTYRSQITFHQLEQKQNNMQDLEICVILSHEHGFRLTFASCFRWIAILYVKLYCIVKIHS